MSLNYELLAIITNCIMPKEILIATKNKSKFLEIGEQLKDLSVVFLNLNDISQNVGGLDLEESAMSFEGNAIIKAMQYGFETGLATLADDSGLEVDALAGRPGVFSARYIDGDDKDRYIRLLEEMRGIADEQRGAQYRAVIAFYHPEKRKVWTVEGVCRGFITKEPQGEGGFGYDPVFFSVDLGKTFGEASREEKASVSHRGRALRKMQEIILREFIE